MLIDCGVAVDHKDDTGLTPLFFAASNGKFYLLIKSMAKVSSTMSGLLINKIEKKIFLIKI